MARPGGDQGWGGEVWASSSLGTLASLSPLEGLAAPSLPDENTGGGGAFHWSVALVTLLAILVSRIALWVGQMGLCQVPSSWQGGSGSSSRSFFSASSLASSRTGRCMSTSKFTVQGKRISMEMALPCGTPATAWCQVGWCLHRWEHLWLRSLHSARSFYGVPAPCRGNLGPQAGLGEVFLWEEEWLFPAAQLYPAVAWCHMPAKNGFYCSI